MFFFLFTSLLNLAENESFCLSILTTPKMLCSIEVSYLLYPLFINEDVRTLSLKVVSLCFGFAVFLTENLILKFSS